MSVSTEAYIYWDGTHGDLNDLCWGDVEDWDWREEEEYQEEIFIPAKDHRRAERFPVHLWSAEYGIFHFVHNECDMTELRETFEKLKRDPRCKKLKFYDPNVDRFIDFN